MAFVVPSSLTYSFTSVGTSSKTTLPSASGVVVSVSTVSSDSGAAYSASTGSFRPPNKRFDLLALAGVLGLGDNILELLLLVIGARAGLFGLQVLGGEPGEDGAAVVGRDVAGPGDWGGVAVGSRGCRYTSWWCGEVEV